MTSAINFYFDFASPYDYFAAMQIDDLAAKYGRDVEWHPVLQGVVLKTLGGGAVLPMKGDYATHDFERTAQFHGIPYKRPSAYPLAPQGAARAMLWVQTKCGDDTAIEFAKAVFKAYFVEGVNIGEPMNVVKIATDMGLDGAALTSGINGIQIKDQLKAEIDLAMARGVFGSPFVIVDGELFWGFDRLQQVQAYLSKGKPYGSALHILPSV